MWLPVCFPGCIHVIPPWSSWRLQEMSHKILLKYISFNQNFEISRKWMKNIPIYSIHFSKTSRKWNKNLPDASLKFITCMWMAWKNLKNRVYTFTGKNCSSEANSFPFKSCMIIIDNRGKEEKCKPLSLKEYPFIYNYLFKDNLYELIKSSDICDWLLANFAWDEFTLCLKLFLIHPSTLQNVIFQCIRLSDDFRHL